MPRARSPAPASQPRPPAGLLLQRLARGELECRNDEVPFSERRSRPHQPSPDRDQLVRRRRATPRGRAEARHPRRPEFPGRGAGLPGGVAVRPSSGIWPPSAAAAPVHVADAGALAVARRNAHRRVGTGRRTDAGRPAARWRGGSLPRCSADRCARPGPEAAESRGVTHGTLDATSVFLVRNMVGAGHPAVARVWPVVAAGSPAGRFHSAGSGGVRRAGRPDGELGAAGPRPVAGADPIRRITWRSSRPRRSTRRCRNWSRLDGDDCEETAFAPPTDAGGARRPGGLGASGLVTAAPWP